MNALQFVFRLGLLIGLAIQIPGSVATAQTSSSKEAQPPAPALRKLSGNDAKRADELDKAIGAALAADRWDRAIASAEELFALRTRVQGPKHFETVDEEWRLKALRQQVSMPKQDRVACQSAETMNGHGEALRAQGKYAQAQPLFQKALEIRRRLLTDDHPDTALSYNNLAFNLKAQGKYAQAQPLYEKALEIYRRLLTDDHPDTATSYNNVAANLNAQGKYAQAQPRLEKALEIFRRLLTDDHPDTATNYNNVAANLNAQGKYAQAQPLYEKALEIYRRLLTDDHPDTARYYNNVAANLNAQGKYAQAQPLFDKALEIRRRLLTDDHPETAASYNNVAGNLQAQGKYAQAQPLYEKALEIRRRLLTDDHPETAASYNNVAGNLQAQGKYAQAQPLYEKPLEINRRLLTDDHPDTARGYHNLAYNLNAQGKYAQAQPLYEKALEIYRRLLTDDHPLTATIYNNVAYNLKAQGKYAQAQPLFEKALEIRRRLLTDDHPETAGSYNNVAYNLNAQGKYAQAQPRFQKALEIHRRLLTDDHPLTATSYNNVAYNLNAQGKYAQAQPLYEKALEIYRRLLTDDHPETALSYNNVAANLDAQGKYAQAQPLYEKALEIFRRLLTDDHPDTATSYNNVAYNLNAQGKYAQAQPLYEKALEIRRRLLTDDHPDTAASYNNVAGNLQAQAKYAQAQPLFENTLEIRRRLLTDDHPDTAASYNNVAYNLNAQGKYGQAQPLFEKALEIRRRLLTDDHPDTAATYGNVAGNLQAQAKYGEARDRWLRAAKSVDAARLRIAFTGLERAGVRWSARPALAALLARLGQPAEAWQQLEEDLGRGLLDELAARKDRKLAPAERARLRELIGALERLDRLVETTPKDLDQAGRAKRFEELKRRRELASIALGEFQTKLVATYGARAGRVASLNEIQAVLPADAALLAWVDIPPAGPNAADPDGEHWGVVVRSGGIPDWVPIAGTGKDGLWTQDDTALAGRVRSELRGRPGAGTADVQSLIKKLRAQRLEPLAKALGAAADGEPTARRLIILPSRSMAGIPVEALLAPDDTRTVSYAPSATVFRYLREQPRPDRHAGLLALGDPVFERHDESSEPKPLPEHGLLVNVVAPGSNAATHGLKPGDVLLAYNAVALHTKDDLKVVAEGNKPVLVDVWRDGRSVQRDLDPGKLGVVLDPRPAPLAIAEHRKFRQMLVAARGGSDDFAPLPGPRCEVEALAVLFQVDDRPTRILLGAEASEPALDRLAASAELGKFAFIHLATHGVIDEAIPTRSAVILTQTGLPDPLEQALSNKPVFDGRLSVREIQRGWDLKAELVTLSACETALGREQGGEGFVGFTQALLMSGARSVCLSLWKVDDTATALLMQRFYANLLGRRPGITAPMPKAGALREAKTWLRGLRRAEALSLTAELSGGIERGKDAKSRQPAELSATVPANGDDDQPYASPHFWAAFVLAGDPD
jgi:tetratricopeptide (TPR) repeat protein